MADDPTDIRWMRQAIALGQRGLGTTWPNPSVGCVLARDGRLVGRGWTAPGGRPHAETQALAAAGKAAKGSTAYVTLEPCSHHGQTPPCAEALVAAGVSRVVVGITDPDPRVSGTGIDRLRGEGIFVTTGVASAEVSGSLSGYLMHRNSGRPWLTLKLAMSLDGRIALGSGESRWITGADARAYAHALRSTHDAVLIGAGTARADNPSLGLRHGVTSPRPPLRIVADPSLSVDLTSKLVATASTQPLWLIHGAEAASERRKVLKGAGVSLIDVPRDETGALRMADAFAKLGNCGLTSILCEGGGRLAASLLAADLVEELIVITAGKAIGGEGVAGIGPLGLSQLADAPAFERVGIRPLGKDTALRFLRARSGQTA